MKKAIIALVGLVLAMLLATVGTVIAAGGGFDDAGYNRQARIFVGTGWSWCMDKVGDVDWCTNYLGPYANDKLVMKWNEAWDTCNAGGDCTGAWTDNEWNGMKGGSGSVWHYKIKWDAGCATSGVPSAEGGYCIWGAYEVTMDQGVDPSYGPGHIWFAKAIPNGYGA